MPKREDDFNFEEQLEEEKRLNERIKENLKKIKYDVKELRISEHHIESRIFIILREQVMLDKDANHQ